MITAEKIQMLRKRQGLSQEQLAERCNVSRQAISKWEADIALPEVDKLLLLGEIFQVSIDFLIKDEMEYSEIKEVHTCGSVCKDTMQKNTLCYTGVIIKESLADELILDDTAVLQTQLWKTDGKPKYWTALFIQSKVPDFPERMAKALYSEAEVGVNWFADFKQGNEKYVIFKDKVLHYQIGNQSEKEYVCAECRKLGIPDGQMNWEE